jgi:ribosomal protein S18 acetylase RimI-like enzyme
MTQVTYRLCNKEDRQKVADFHIPNHIDASVRTEEERIVQTEELPQDFPSLYSDEIFAKDTTLVAEIGGRIVGSISLQSTSADECYLNIFSTATDVRRQGIGSKLMEMILNIAKEQGHKVAKLITLQGVMLDAIKLYERFGFRKTLVEDGTCGYIIATYEKNLQ